MRQMPFCDIRRVALLLLASACSACSELAPVVDSAADVQKLPRDEESVRVRGLADRDIPSLQRFRNLNELCFESGYGVEQAKITDKGLAVLAKLELPNLEFLNLGRCEKITDFGIAEVIKIDSLKSLKLPGCPRITDGVISIINSNSNLTALDLRGCSNITDNGVKLLAEKRNWELIQLGGCTKVSDAAVERLRRSLPTARIVKDDFEWTQY